MWGASEPAEGHARPNLWILGQAVAGKHDAPPIELFRLLTTCYLVSVFLLSLASVSSMFYPTFPRLERALGVTGTCTFAIVEQEKTRTAWRSSRQKPMNGLASLAVGVLSRLEPFPAPPLPTIAVEGPRRTEFNAARRAVLRGGKAATMWDACCRDRLEYAGDKQLSLYLIDRIHSRYPLVFPGENNLACFQPPSLSLRYIDVGLWFMLAVRCDR